MMFAPSSKLVRHIGRSLLSRGVVSAAIAVLLVVTAGGSSSTAAQTKYSLWVIYGLLALSLSFLWGHAGIFSFGQTALFGGGGYAYAVLSMNIVDSGDGTAALILVSGLFGGLVATLLGYFMFWGRIGDVYLAILMLAVTMMLFTVMSSTAGPQYRLGEASLGGFNGMPGIPPLLFAGYPLTPLGFLVIALLVAAISYVGLVSLTVSRFGRVLAGIRENEQRVELLGYDPRVYKLGAFALAGALAGLAGALFAAWGTFINPEVFSLSQAALVVIWVMVGGRSSLAGAFVGVFLAQSVADASDQIVAGQTPLILGLALIGVVFLLPAGVVPTLVGLVNRVRPAYGHTHPQPLVRKRAGRRRFDRASSGVVSGAVGRRLARTVSAVELSQRFGGVTAVDGVSIKFEGPAVHVMIGPNGAGKSTLFGVLTGRHRATAGRVLLDDHDVTSLPAFRRARLGVGVKMQAPSIFPGLTVQENLNLATQSPTAAGSEEIDGLLEATNLQVRTGAQADQLSHGEKQWLEIAMVAAAGPSVILLDEPVAGMTPEEKELTKKLILSLACKYTVVVVEHDMAFVGSLNAHTTLLHQGRILMTGEFREVCSDPRVIEIYLGRDHVTA